MSVSNEVFELLGRSGALRFGSFRLKSGGLSPFFLNLGDVASGADLEALGGLLATGLREAFPDTTLLFGPAYKGIVLATAASIAASRQHGWDLPICYDRKEAKDHGEGGLLVGRAPRPGDRVVIVDDVLTRGGTKAEAAAMLRERYGVEVHGILVVVDRRVSVVPNDAPLPPLKALATLADLLRWLEARDPARASAVREFTEGRPPWTQA